MSFAPVDGHEICTGCHRLRFLCDSDPLPCEGCDCESERGEA